MGKRYDDFGKEIEFAKYVDIEDLAMRYGYTFRTSGKHRICNNKEGLVLYPATNSFKNFYENVGGTTIDFVMNEEGVDFKTAVSRILDNAVTYSSKTDIDRKESNRRENATLELPEANKDHRRVFAYLNTTRKISGDVISRMLHERRIYESADKHNTIFIAYDKDGKAKHGYIRGTSSYVRFRGDVPGSDKQYGFCIKGSSDTLIVFEAPIDLLSYMTLVPDCNDTLVALGMLSDEPIYTCLKDYDYLKKVSFVIDNDKPGNNAKTQMENKLMENGYQIVENAVFNKMCEENCKDVNELLCKIKTPEVSMSYTKSR